ncbi:DEAD/DEAH box helicase [uncultured Corynebacterium sp.]|uniref:DEAD/DEAH box helicase n=1 Tax=uncultured Corynebacterium sp. TaxID=159447 RepID=UPI0025F919D6|nr:DEAD/DEAH box helicase [uncultured Corynebacterium sp.]
MADSGAKSVVPGPHGNSYGADLLTALTPLTRDNSPSDAGAGTDTDTTNTVITYVRTESARLSTSVDWPEWTDPDLRTHLIDEGIERPWSHQIATAEHARNGDDVVIATGTASGKSLGYQLAVTDALIHEPTASCLYLSPTKALAQDQRAAMARLLASSPALKDAMVATYDGDTPGDARRLIRDEARVIISNPDMVHASILGNHERWTRLLRTLRFLIVDECHVYRGVFGAHVSLVLRRLLRLAHRAGARPTVVLASATTADPAGQAQRLTGRPTVAVTEDGSPRGERTVALWEPGFLENTVGEHGAPVRRAATTEAAAIMAHTIAEGARTLTFVRSRRGAEITALACADDLTGMGRGEDARRIASYRAGYTPEARRELERKLDDGELLGMAATSALELGIDVGGLDVVVSCGFPGTVASFRQQAGRAGRRGQGCLVVMVASDNPMDTYLVHHPADLLDHPVEASVFDPTNPYVLADHVLCAAAEAPLTDGEVTAFGGDVDATDVVRQLASQGLLRRRPRGIFADVDAATGVHARVNIRGGSGDQVLIVDVTSGTVLGTVDAARAVGEVHDGAVYVHQGESYVVDSLSLEECVAAVHPEAPEWHTRAMETTEIRMGQVYSTVEIGGTDSAPSGIWLADVQVQVTHQVTGYQRRTSDGEVLQTVPLDVPPQRLVTRAAAYTVDPGVLFDLGIEEPLWPGTLHAAEHAAIGMLPLLATCDRWDIGGVSTVLHSDTGFPTVFVYDGYAGGAGFAEAGFGRFAEWMRMTAEAVESCACESGCPSCVQSPKCGNGNDPLYKQGAAVLLRALAEKAGAAG